MNPPNSFVSSLVRLAPGIAFLGATLALLVMAHERASFDDPRYEAYTVMIKGRVVSPPLPFLHTAAGHLLLTSTFLGGLGLGLAASFLSLAKGQGWARRYAPLASIVAVLLVFAWMKMNPPPLTHL